MFPSPAFLARTTSSDNFSLYCTYLTGGVQLLGELVGGVLRLLMDWSSVGAKPMDL